MRNAPRPPETLEQRVARVVAAVRRQCELRKRELLEIEGEAKAAGLRVEPIAPLMAYFRRRAGDLPPKEREAHPRQLELWPRSPPSGIADRPV